MIIKPRAFTLLAPATNPADPLPVGAIVYEFNGHDFGCVDDDWRFGKIRSKACTLDPDGLAGPFFTVEVAHLKEV